MTEYETIEKWQATSNYCGPDWSEYYHGPGVCRDSGTLSRSNFSVFLREIGGESETVRIVRAGHWAYGWYEWIAIHESDTKACQHADDLMTALEEHLALCDQHHADLEAEAVKELWANMSIRQRMAACKRAGVPFLAARHDDLPTHPAAWVVYDDLAQEVR